MREGSTTLIAIVAIILSIVSIGMNLTGSAISDRDDIFYNDGYVGIGTTTPNFPLDVNGDARISGDVRIQDDLTVEKNSTGLSVSAGNSYGLEVTQGPGSTSSGVFIGDFGFDLAGVVQTFNQPLSLNPAGNNVGIGTTSPQKLLDVRGVGGAILLDPNTHINWTEITFNDKDGLTSSRILQCEGSGCSFGKQLFFQSVRDFKFTGINTQIVPQPNVFIKSLNESGIVSSCSGCAFVCVNDKGKLIRSPTPCV